MRGQLVPSKVIRIDRQVSLLPFLPQARQRWQDSVYSFCSHHSGGVRDKNCTDVPASRRNVFLNICRRNMNGVIDYKQKVSKSHTTSNLKSRHKLKNNEAKTHVCLAVSPSSGLSCSMPGSLAQNQSWCCREEMALTNQP